MKSTPAIPRTIANNPNSRFVRFDRSPPLPGLKVWTGLSGLARLGPPVDVVAELPLPPLVNVLVVVTRGDEFAVAAAGEVAVTAAVPILPVILIPYTPGEPLALLPPDAEAEADTATATAAAFILYFSNVLSVCPAA